MKGHAKLVFCLLELIQKDVPFQWITKCQQEFEKLKYKLITTIILVTFNFKNLSYLMWIALFKMWVTIKK
jgi:hypothetical protein